MTLSGGEEGGWERRKSIGGGWEEGEGGKEVEEGRVEGGGWEEGEGEGREGTPKMGGRGGWEEGRVGEKGGLEGGRVGGGREGGWKGRGWEGGEDPYVHGAYLKVGQAFKG